MSLSNDLFNHDVTPKSTRRGRSLQGCSTCRRRHAKCDERQPSCLVCEDQGIKCEGYEINLVFDGSPRQNSLCRRPLFSLEMRQHMTEILTTSVRPEDVDIYLSRVDDGCSNIQDSVDFSANTGPFGVFSMKPVEGQLQRSTEASLSRMSPTELGEVAEPSPDVDAFLVDDALMECLFQGANMPIGLDYDHFSLANSSSSVEFESINDFPITHPASVTSPNSLSMMPLPPNLAPAYAPVLISHYRDVIVPQFSPVLPAKTPWRILHVPVAMETLAQLSMGEAATSARMTIFYSILATSALSLLGSTPEECVPAWQTQADDFFVQAKSHFRMALRQIVTSDKKVRYKEMLIAFLCMSTLWVRISMLKNFKPSIQLSPGNEVFVANLFNLK